MNFDFSVDFQKEGYQMLAHLENFVVPADVSTDKEHPSPGNLFLASVATCTAATAAWYCRTHQLPLPRAVHFKGQMDDETEMFVQVSFEIEVPSDFPHRQYDALIRAAESCWVKKLWQNPPQFNTLIRAT